MLLFVDYEHASRYEAGGVDWLLAARTRITYRLEDLSGRPCMLVRYDRVTPELVARLGVEAIFISGQGTDPDRYDPVDLAPLQGIVRDAGLPVFGFCGGWQFMAQAFGADLVEIEVPEARRGDEIVAEWPSGLAEFGYHPVALADVEHPMLSGLEAEPVFRHAHRLHIPALPDGFDVLASTPITPVQLAVDADRRMVGTQFHPEYWTDEHSAGRTLIENFLRWADLI